MPIKQQYQPLHRFAQMIRSLSMRARVAIAAVAFVGLGIAAVAAAGSAAAATSGSDPHAVVGCVNGAHARPYSYVPWRGLWEVYTGAPGASLKCPTGSWKASMASSAQLSATNSQVSTNTAGVAANKSASSTNATSIAANSALLKRTDNALKGVASNVGKIKGVQADEPYATGTLTNPVQPNYDPAIQPGQTAVVWTGCPAGKAAISGGFRIGANVNAWESFSPQSGNKPNGMEVLASEPAYYTTDSSGNSTLTNAYGTSDQVNQNGAYLPNAWAVTVYNGSSSVQHARAAVVCADVSS